LRQRYRYAAVLALVLTAACADGPSTPDATVIKTLQVAPARVVCTGAGPQLCLQVRETSSAPWTNLYGEIVGFNYEPGFLYEIRIKEETVANPPADGSSVLRTLIQILSKTPA
jgi:hypothetical protein